MAVCRRWVFYGLVTSASNVADVVRVTTAPSLAAGCNLSVRDGVTRARREDGGRDCRLTRSPHVQTVPRCSFVLAVAHVHRKQANERFEGPRAVKMWWSATRYERRQTSACMLSLTASSWNPPSYCERSRCRPFPVSVRERLGNAGTPFGRTSSLPPTISTCSPGHCRCKDPSAELR